jgi:hypothetical protein
MLQLLSPNFPILWVTIYRCIASSRIHLNKQQCAHNLQTTSCKVWFMNFNVHCWVLASCYSLAQLMFGFLNKPLWFVIHKPSSPLGLASNLQWLIIFGYKFTSSLLGLQRWWSWTIGWRTFGKSNGCDHSKMEQLNN